MLPSLARCVRKTGTNQLAFVLGKLQYFPGFAQFRGPSVFGYRLLSFSHSYSLSLAHSQIFLLFFLTLIGVSSMVVEYFSIPGGSGSGSRNSGTSSPRIDPISGSASGIGQDCGSARRRNRISYSSSSGLTPPPSKPSPPVNKKSTSNSKKIRVVSSLGKPGNGTPATTVVPRESSSSSNGKHHHHQKQQQRGAGENDDESVVKRIW